VVATSKIGGFQLKWLEIIELRIDTFDRNQVVSDLEMIIKELKLPKQKLKLGLYRHAYIETDFSIHLVHDSENIQPSGSPLSRHLASVLTEFGIIHRTVWVRMH
jgi:hypothetical protein